MSVGTSLFCTAYIFLLLALMTTAWPMVSPFFLRSRNMQFSNSKRSATEPTDLFREQFINPSEILAVLLLLGGDVVQRAIAQLTGGRHDPFTPVVFSFGWVSYAFNATVSAVGDGTFLPQPDYPGTVIDIGSGDSRTNQSWVIGRLIRDLELEVERKAQPTELDSGLLVTVYKAIPGGGPGEEARGPKKDIVWWSFVPVVLVQLVLATIPIVQRRNWSIMLVTAAGTFLAVLTASLPSMRWEKFQGRRHSRATYAITRGNGHKHVFLLLPDTLTKDNGDSRREGLGALSSLPYLTEMASASHRASFWTRFFFCILALFWVLLLVTVGALDSDTWYLFGIGMLGMAHAIFVSGWPRNPEAHGIYLEPLITADGADGALGRRLETNRPGPGAMKILLDLEIEFPGAGHSLLPLFFPGRLRDDEERQWQEIIRSKDSIHDRLKEKRQHFWPNDPIEEVRTEN